MAAGSRSQQKLGSAVIAFQDLTYVIFAPLGGRIYVGRHLLEMLIVLAEPVGLVHLEQCNVVCLLDLFDGAGHPSEAIMNDGER